MALSQEKTKEIALKESELRWNEARDRLRYSVEYAQAGIKGLFLANGGAIIALLTFAGNSGAIEEPRALFWSFIWFALGLTAAIGIYIAGYMSQGYVMNAEYNLSRQALSDAYDLELAFHAKPWEDKSERAEGTGFALAIFSLVMFATGAFVAVDAIT